MPARICLWASLLAALGCTPQGAASKTSPAPALDDSPPVAAATNSSAHSGPTPVPAPVASDPPSRKSADGGLSVDASPVDAAGTSGARAKVVSIGMHVGGGPFDEVTKQPFLRSAEPRYPELAACFGRVNPAKQGEFGVDLTIEADGGRAKVANPRTTLRGEGFVECAVAFWKSIDFERSPHGKKVVSYSVRFVPVASLAK